MYKRNLLYIKIRVYDYELKAIIDTGAQVSVISEDLCEFLEIKPFIDTNRKGTAQGMGQCNITGIIEGLMIKIEQMDVTLNLTVVDSNTHKYLMLLGLDFLYGYKSTIDLNQGVIRMNNNQEIKILNETESNNLEIPVNVIKSKLNHTYRNMINTLYDHKEEIVTILNRVISNILSNPDMYKYRMINKESKTFKPIADNTSCMDFLYTIGFKDEDEGKITFKGDIRMLKHVKMLLV